MTVDRIALASSFESSFGRPPGLISEAPGRVNLIGEHTDYNRGFVLPVAINFTVAVAAAAREDGTVRARSLDFEQWDEFQAATVRRFMGTAGWRNYVRGVAWALQDNNVPLNGADLAITGDVPKGAGLSSSAALEVAVAGALAAVVGAEIGLVELAASCRRAENLFVGVQCGVMDQMASVLGASGNAILIDCDSLKTELVPLPDGVELVVVDSAVSRNLADTAYNERREDCSRAAAMLGVESLRDADIQGVGSLPDPIGRRARHVITENARVLAMVEALSREDIGAAGRLMYESHASLRDDFEVSVPELDLLVDLACAQEGVIGARLTGAGFGGCTINLVETAGVEEFGRSIEAAYGRETGREAGVYWCRPSDGLRVIDGR
jgi:galactokinase